LAQVLLWTSELYFRRKRRAIALRWPYVLFVGRRTDVLVRWPQPCIAARMASGSAFCSGSFAKKRLLISGTYFSSISLKTSNFGLRVVHF
jgi:hypothetical protein